ncbi:MAG: zinc ribbon domain-containing protein [Anaerolineae bacterium]|nr:zinc ribbon domain-containing protein [Anaerolineae bacterium]
MATCKTCRGEYTDPQLVCPRCRRVLQDPASRCPHCRSRIQEQRICPRCKSDVAGWEQGPLPFQDFFTRGGFLGLAPPFVILLLWAFKWAQEPQSIHHHLTSVIGVLLAALAFFGLFAVRYELRERKWAAQIYRVSLPILSPGFIVVGLFALGIVSMAVAFILYKTAVEPITLLQRTIFTVTYCLACASFTAALTFSMLQWQLRSVDERVPQPLFVHTDRLLKVVLCTAGTSLRRDNAPVGAEAGRDFEIIEVTRERKNGGIHVLVREHRFARHPDIHQGLLTRPIPEDRAWRIEADRWGRIQTLKPHPLPRTIGSAGQQEG